jgi:hypothetical protein
VNRDISWRFIPATKFAKGASKIQFFAPADKYCCIITKIDPNQEGYGIKTFLIQNLKVVKQKKFVYPVEQLHSRIFLILSFHRNF